MTLQKFLKSKHYLIWYTKNYQSLSDSTIIEAVLNYGDWDDFKKLISLFGLKKTARVFRHEVRKKRNNYRPEIKNYFSLYFQKYA